MPSSVTYLKKTLVQIPVSKLKDMRVQGTWVVYRIHKNIKYSKIKSEPIKVIRYYFIKDEKMNISNLNPCLTLYLPMELLERDYFSNLTFPELFGESFAF